MDTLILSSGGPEGENMGFSRRQGKILDFVRRQLNSSSPKTRKLAREFLRKRE